MKLIEYRILMPMTVEQNQIGQIWSFCEISRLNTGGGEGVEILKNEIFSLPPDVQDTQLKHHLPEYVNYEAQKKLYNSENKQEKKMTKNSSGSTSLFSLSSFMSLRSKSSTTATTDNDKQMPQRSSSLRKNSSESANLSHSKSMDIKPVVVDPSQVTVSTSTDENNNNKPVKHGQYTHKIYKMTSKLPWFVRKILPKATTEIEEKSWNVYPVVKTVLTNEFFINCARIELDTITRACLSDGTCEDNVHNLTAEQLASREIVYIDLAESVPPSYYKAEEDPTLYRSEKAGIGPLVKGWQEKQRPLICCYKLVFAEFKVFGLQSRAESYLRNMYKDLFAVFHRQIFCWMDKWYDMSLEQVRDIERQLAQELREKINKGEISKNTLEQQD